MKLGIQVGLGPGHIVLDGNPAPLPPKGHSPPIFGPYLLRPNGCIDQDVTWYGARPHHRDQDPPVEYYLLKDVATYLSRSRSRSGLSNGTNTSDIDDILNFVDH